MRSATPLLLTLGAAAFFLGGCANPQAAVQSALAGVCSGGGVPEAAAYSGGGVHPIVVLASNGENHDWANGLPEEWVPESVEAAQLVACVEDEGEREIEECLYNGPSITRFQYQVSLRLVEARTGAQVASTVLEGSMPRECRQSEDYDLTRLEGSHVSLGTAVDWLRRHVEDAVLAANAGQAPSGSGVVPPHAWVGQEVWVYCGQAGLSPTVVEGGLPVILSWSWMGASEADVQDYVGAAAFGLRLDSESVDLSGAALSSEECEWGICATWRLPPVDLERGTHTAVMTVTLSREVSTGLDFDENGIPEADSAGVWEATPCEIIVE